MRRFPTPPKKLLAALLGPVPVGRRQAIGLSERLSAATSLVSGLEFLSDRSQIRPGGLNDWSINRELYADCSRPVRKALDILAHERTTTALYAARVAASAALLLPGEGRWRGAANLFLGLSGAALYPHHRLGSDGSDQASGMVQTATGLARLSTSPQTQDALLWYVALQSNLSYLVSGWVKLLGRDWRTGAALGGVLRTRTYGERHLWQLTRRHPRAARALAHGVLALECLFPVLYLRGGKLARPVLATTVSFHLANGFVMGLGRFVTSFAAMHPMVAYTSTPAHHPAVAGRDDRAPRAAALVLAGGVALAGALATARRLRVTDGWPGTEWVTTRHGNRLAYDTTLSADGSGPVVVFVHGLTALPEHFGWLTQTLRIRSAHELLTYSRAGYGPSRYAGTRPYTLQESVDDLVDLVAQTVPAHRQVVLAGHSLGGELARRAAVRLGDRVHAVVYLDSSHPAELHRSEQQDESARRLTGAIRTFTNSLRMGMGVLLNRPSWVDNLPRPFRARALHQYADARMWQAGQREWRATEQDFRGHSGELPPVAAHALVLSAQHTVDRDPEQLLLHRELAAAHRGAGRLVQETVIEGADHDSLLTRAEYALQAGERILAFLDSTAHRPGTAGTASPDRTPAREVS
ncbi:alpha/beta fold hydrolase [Streptomyces sp. AA0539]|uniref:alpha/beta fold hydrolase n=1 Tax=Streptomyces sp. AA0539 TaxID=1210045 RepID=UPI0002EE6D18|nr:alpha/beta fold hydrolase [Streptomyces sp. AA0539]